MKKSLHRAGEGASPNHVSAHPVLVVHLTVIRKTVNRGIITDRISVQLQVAQLRQFPDDTDIGYIVVTDDQMIDFFEISQHTDIFYHILSHAQVSDVIEFCDG